MKKMTTQKTAKTETKVTTPAAKKAVKPVEKKTVKSFWTEKKVASLLTWFEKMKGKEKAYDKIAAKIGTTRSAVYKKLGRIGKIDAPWTKKKS